MQPQRSELCKAPRSAYGGAEIRARRGERVPLPEVYIDVHDQSGTEFNAVLRSIYAPLRQLNKIKKTVFAHRLYYFVD